MASRLNHPCRPPPDFHHLSMSLQKWGIQKRTSNSKFGAHSVETVNLLHLFIQTQEFGFFRLHLCLCRYLLFPVVHIYWISHPLNLIDLFSHKLLGSYSFFISDFYNWSFKNQKPRLYVCICKILLVCFIPR